ARHLRIIKGYTQQPKRHFTGPDGQYPERYKVNVQQKFFHEKRFTERFNPERMHSAIQPFYGKKRIPRIFFY
ncbi:MAG: hypothetical protein AAF570_01655, partial [Bacteroidota bacterium]